MTRMDLARLGLLKGITQRMEWLTQRQHVLSENIANADTPHYQARDLTAFSTELGTAMAMTDPAHQEGAGGARVTRPDKDRKPWEVKPDGNAVSIEDQMAKSAETAADFQMITNLYRKQVGMIRAAIGRTN